MTQDVASIKKALDALGEHFDTVHIFATRHEPAIEDGTITINKGIGNWFARYGQIKRWSNADHREQKEINEGSL